MGMKNQSPYIKIDRGQTCSVDKTLPSTLSKPNIAQIGRETSSNQVLHIHVLSIGNSSESRKVRNGVVEGVAV